MRDLLVDALVAQSKGSNNFEQDMDEVIFGFDNRVESEGRHDIRPLIGQRESDTLKKTTLSWHTYEVTLLGQYKIKFVMTVQNS